jgi:hypothetical protein
MANLRLTELDADNEVLAIQTIPIATPFPIGSVQPTGFGPRPNPGGVQSAPFRSGTVQLVLSPDAGSQATVTFGESPTPLINGIVITVTTSLPRYASRLAVL